MQDPFRKTYRPLSDSQKKMMSDARDQAAELLEIIERAEQNFDVRCCRLARTKLEEVVMWLCKGITYVPED